MSNILTNILILLAGLVCGTRLGAIVMCLNIASKDDKEK